MNFVFSVISGGRNYKDIKHIPLHIRNKQWQESLVPIKKNAKIKHKGLRNCDLLDIGKNMETLDPESDSAKFYMDQKGPRILCVSGHVSFDYENQLAAEAQYNNSLEYHVEKEDNSMYESNNDICSHCHRHQKSLSV